MNYLYPIYTEQTECQDCYKCIRQCPVKAIRVDNGHATVVSELCIMCGNCVKNCSAKAKHVRDDVPKAKQLMQLKKRVSASLAPSFTTEFAEYAPNQIIAALKKRMVNMSRDYVRLCVKMKILKMPYCHAMKTIIKVVLHGGVTLMIKETHIQ